MPPDLSLRELERCCQRELSKRAYVYPRQVTAGWMTSALAIKEMALMRACVEHFKKLADEEDEKGRLL